MTTESQPRGVAEQARAVADLLNPAADEPREEQLADVAGTEVPEQAAPGESPEGAVEAGSEAPATEARTPTAEEIRTVVDFAKAAGWDPAELYALSMKLDTGEEIPLGQIKDKLQEHGRQAAELAAQREALANEHKQLRQAAEQLMRGQQQLSEAALNARGRMESVQARFNGINWEALKEADPGRYAALQQDFAVEYSAAKAEYGRAMQQQQLQQQAFWEHTVVEHDQRFLQAVPEWRNPEIASREGPEISKFLMDVIGFTPQELMTIPDYRARLVGRMAWQYWQHQQKVATATERARQAPKPVMRPGSGGAQGTVQSRRVSELEQKAKTTRNPRDQAAAVAAILGSAR